MESAPITPGVTADGGGVSAVRPANGPTCESSTVKLSSCINLNIGAISHLWEHQKGDFLKGHCDEYSCTADEVFVFHLLKIHAKFCAEPSCNLYSCRSSSHMIEETEHALGKLKVNSNFKLEPNFAETMKLASSNLDMLHRSGQIMSRSGSDYNSIQNASECTEPENSHCVPVSRRLSTTDGLATLDQLETLAASRPLNLTGERLCLTLTNNNNNSIWLKICIICIHVSYRLN